MSIESKTDFVILSVVGQTMSLELYTELSIFVATLKLKGIVPVVLQENISLSAIWRRNRLAYGRGQVLMSFVLPA